MTKMPSLEEYRDFAQPAELQKSVNLLRGLVAGMQADGVVGKAETAELVNWCALRENLRARHPFDELLAAVDRILEDGRISAEEQADLLWLCDHINGENIPDYYDALTASIQYLQGFAHGLLADARLDDEEIHALQRWLPGNEFLAGTWPFDELSSMVNAVLADGVITEPERAALMGFLGSLVEFKESCNLNEPDFTALREKYKVSGICAMCPEIQFEGRTFVFTGESYRATRAEIHEKIISLGGKAKTAVSKKTDYLVVGNAGNPCWAFSCYGRKVEEAIAFRKQGAKLLIVNETDFWDAVEDVKLP